MTKGVWMAGAALLALLAGAGVRADEAKGKSLFDGKCAMCHGKDGSKKFGDLKAKSAEELAKTVKEGIKGKGMPAFAGKLSDEEVKDVVAYAQSLKK